MSASRGRVVAGTTVLVVGALVRFFRLGSGPIDPFYAATVRSMLVSPHNWLYAAFEPGGSVSVDKPPLAYWIQSLVALLGGFDSRSLVLPQAIAGSLSALALYALVRRWRGTVAGVVAGLTLAVTPVEVATSRTNAGDPILVLLQILAVGAVIRGIRRGRRRWLVLGGVALALGFDVKEIAAFIVVPSIAVAIVLGEAQRRYSKLASIAVFLGSLVLISVAWPLLVALTPPEYRPAVMHSPSNSIWEQIFVYNGISAVGSPNLVTIDGSPYARSEFALVREPPSIWRLFMPSHATQIGLLLIVALLGFASVLLRMVGQRERDLVAILVSVWFLTAMSVLSAAGRLAPQYLELLVAPTAALVGAAVATGWERWRRQTDWLLPIMMAVEAIYCILIVHRATSGADVDPLLLNASVLLLVAAVIGAVIWFVYRARLGKTSPSSWNSLVTRAVPLVAIGTLLLPPAILSVALAAPDLVAAWSPAGDPWKHLDLARARQAYQTIVAQSGTGRLAPIGQSSFQGFRQITLSESLIRFLESNRGSARFLVAAPGYGVAAQLVLDTKQPIFVYYDDFLNRPSVATATVAALVSHGDVRTVVAPNDLAARDPSLSQWLRTTMSDQTRQINDSSAANVRVYVARRGSSD